MHSLGARILVATVLATTSIGRAHAAEDPLGSFAEIARGDGEVSQVEATVAEEPVPDPTAASYGRQATWTEASVDQAYAAYADIVMLSSGSSPEILSSGRMSLRFAEREHFDLARELARHLGERIRRADRPSLDAWPSGPPAPPDPRSDGPSHSLLPDPPVVPTESAGVPELPALVRLDLARRRLEVLVGELRRYRLQWDTLRPFDQETLLLAPEGHRKPLSGAHAGFTWWALPPQRRPGRPLVDAQQLPPSELLRIARALASAARDHATRAVNLYWALDRWEVTRETLAPDRRARLSRAQTMALRFFDHVAQALAQVECGRVLTLPLDPTTRWTAERELERARRTLEIALRNMRERGAVFVRPGRAGDGLVHLLPRSPDPLLDRLEHFFGADATGPMSLAPWSLANYETRIGWRPPSSEGRP